MLKKLVFASLFLTVAAAAQAEITDIYLEQVFAGTIGDDLTPDTDVVVFDLKVEITGDDAWTAAGGTAVGVPWATLTGGSFFQHGAGSDGPPNPVFFPVYSALEYDSFYTTHLGWPNVASQGVAPGFAFGPQDTATQLNADWFWTPDGNFYPGTHTIARATVAPGGKGWELCVAVQVGSIESPLQLYEYCIPEPGSLALLALGGLALIRRR
jgi:hypothetical protein